MSDYLYNLPNNTAGVDNLLVDTITLFPTLPSLIMVFVFLTVFIGGITRQKIRTGTADYPAWAVLGSISIFILLPYQI